MRKNFDNSQITLYLILALAMMSIMYLFILPLILGCILALVLGPIVLKVNKQVENYNTSLKIVFGLGITIISVPMIMLVASGVESLVAYSQNTDFADLETKFNLITPKILGVISPYLEQFGLNYEKVKPTVMTIGTKTASIFLLGIKTLFNNIPKILLDSFVIAFSSYFTLLHKESLMRWLKDNPFIDEKTNETFFKIVHDISYSVILAALVCGFLQMIVMLLAALLAGNNQWLLVAVLTFVLSFVPVVGTAPVTATVIIYSLATNSYYALTIYIIAICCLFVIDNIIKPTLIGNKANINPILAFLSAIGGLNIFGFYGLFFGPILIGVSLAMMKHAWGSSENN